ncbi:MAG: RodZ domain-containing protein [Syntrophorhabdales bacterium]|jgi:transcriptional regulator with XRE-family HTH domain
MPFDLVEIGEILRKAREQRGLSVEEASEVLYLKKSVIHAIESGDWSALPHAIYVKGYSTQYAKYLNVYERIAPELAKGHETPSVRPLGRTETQVPTRVREWRERPRVRKAILGGSIAVVAIITLLLFLHGQREISLPPQYETVARNSPDTQANWPVGNETKKLMIACQERTWIRIVIDGAEKKEVMLNPEEVVMFTARDKFDLLVGNAGGVKLFFDGKDTKFEGASGEVKRVTLP